MTSETSDIKLVHIQKEDVLNEFKKVKEIVYEPVIVKKEFDYSIFDVPSNPDRLNNENFSYDPSEGKLHDKKGIIYKKLVELGYLDDE